MIDDKEIKKLMSEYGDILEQNSDEYNDIVAEVINYEGFVLYSNEEFGKSIKYYDEAILKDPYNSKYLSNKAYALYGLKKYDEAIDFFDKSLKIDPYFQNAIEGKACTSNERGISLYTQEKYKEAIKYFDMAMELLPNTPKFIENRKICLQKINSLGLDADESSEIEEVICESCGSKNFVEENGIPTCKSCGTKYPNMSLAVVDREKAREKKRREQEIEGLLNPQFRIGSGGDDTPCGDGTTINGNPYYKSHWNGKVIVEPKPGILSDDEILEYAPESKAAKKIRKQRKKGLFSGLLGN